MILWFLHVTFLQIDAALIALLNAVPSLLTARGALTFLGYDDKQRSKTLNSVESDASSRHDNHNESEKAGMGPLLAALAERPKRRLQLGTTRHIRTNSANDHGDRWPDDQIVNTMPRLSSVFVVASMLMLHFY